MRSQMVDYISFFKNFVDTGLFSDEETCAYIQLYRQGDVQARNLVIIHHLDLVFSIVEQAPKVSFLGIEDMMDLGIVGLIKAVDTFLVSKNVEFMNYASRCIKNEIFMAFRVDKKHENVMSLEQEKSYFEKCVLDDDFMLEIEEDELKGHLRDLILELPYRDQLIVCLYYGFYDGNTYSQEAIGAKLHLNQSYVSRVIKADVNYLRCQLGSLGYGEKISMVHSLRFTKKRNFQTK